MTRRRLLSLAVLATIVALFAGAAIVVRIASGARWNEMATWAQQARAEYERRDFRRPVAWGEQHAGSAFLHYRRAVALAQPLLRDQDRLGALWAQMALQKEARVGDPMTPDEAEALRAAWAPALAALHRGAHSSDGGPALEPGAPIEIANLLCLRWLVNVTVLEAFSAQANGEHRRAAELLLDALMPAVDLLRSPSTVDKMIATSLAGIVVLQGCSDERLRRLDRDALDLLATGLARLDAHVPVEVSLLDDLMVSALFLQTGGGEDETPASWHHAFSRRWRTADELLEQVRRASEPAPTGSRWPERERWLGQLEQQSWPAASAERSVRYVLAELRCLRLAVDHYRGADVVERADPLGDGAIAVVEGADEIRFVSDGLGGPRAQRTVARR
jgi:hypothetical protein